MGEGGLLSGRGFPLGGWRGGGGERREGVEERKG